MLWASGAQTPSEAVEKEVSVPYMGRVTSGYIQTHEPGMILKLAQDVRSGKTPIGELNSLVGPKTAQGLVRADLSRIRIPRSRKGGPAKSDGASVSTSALHESGLLHVLSVPEHSPEVLSFPPLYEGAQASSILTLTAPVDGPLTAILPENANFKIVEMRLYDGTLVRLRDGSEAPRVVARKTSPPWTFSAEAGNRLIVKVRFKPDFQLGKNMAGPKQSVLTLAGHPDKTKSSTGRPWKLLIPVKGQFRGVYIGVLAFPMPADILYVKPEAYKPGATYPFKATLRLVNPKGAAHGTVKPVSLPTAVTMSPIDISIAKGETKDVDLKFSIGTFGPFHIQDTAFPIRVQLDMDGRSHMLDYSLFVYDGFHHWNWYGLEVGSVKMNLSLYLNSSGDYRFSMAGHNSDFFRGRTILAKGFFDGKQYFELVGSAGGSGHSTEGVFNTHVSRENTDLKAQFVDLSKKKLKYHIRVFPPL